MKISFVALDGIRKTILMPTDGLYEGFQSGDMVARLALADWVEEQGLTTAALVWRWGRPVAACRILGPLVPGAVTWRASPVRPVLNGLRWYGNEHGDREWDECNQETYYASSHLLVDGRPCGPEWLFLWSCFGEHLAVPSYAARDVPRPWPECCMPARQPKISRPGEETEYIVWPMTELLPSEDAP